MDHQRERAAVSTFSSAAAIPKHPTLLESVPSALPARRHQWTAMLRDVWRGITDERSVTVFADTKKGLPSRYSAYQSVSISARNSLTFLVNYFLVKFIIGLSIETPSFCFRCFNCRGSKHRLSPRWSCKTGSQKGFDCLNSSSVQPRKTVRCGFTMSSPAACRMFFSRTSLRVVTNKTWYRQGSLAENCD